MTFSFLFKTFSGAMCVWEASSCIKCWQAPGRQLSAAAQAQSTAGSTWPASCHYGGDGLAGRGGGVGRRTLQLPRLAGGGTGLLTLNDLRNQGGDQNLLDK